MSDNDNDEPPKPVKDYSHVPKGILDNMIQPGEVRNPYGRLGKPGHIAKPNPPRPGKPLRVIINGGDTGRVFRTLDVIGDYDYENAIVSLLPKAIAKLSEQLDATFGDSETPDYVTRERAINIVLERAVGKVPDRKELTGKDGGPMQIEDNTTNVTVLLRAALGGVKVDSDVIEGESES